MLIYKSNILFDDLSQSSPIVNSQSTLLLALGDATGRSLRLARSRYDVPSSIRGEGFRFPEDPNLKASQSSHLLGVRSFGSEL